MIPLKDPGELAETEESGYFFHRLGELRIGKGEGPSGEGEKISIAVSAFHDKIVISSGIGMWNT